MTQHIENCPRNIAVSPVGMTVTILQLLHQALQTQRLKATLRRERAQLLTMSAAQLNDIGIDRSAAIAEANRSDIPSLRNM